MHKHNSGVLGLNATLQTKIIREYYRPYFGKLKDPVLHIVPLKLVLFLELRGFVLSRYPQQGHQKLFH